MDGEDNLCGTVDNAATSAGTGRRVGTTATSGSSASNNDGDELTVVPPVKRLDQDNDADSLQTEGQKPESELGTKDKAAKGSKAKGGASKRTARKDHVAKGRFSNGHRTKGSATTELVTKRSTTKGPAAKATRSKVHATEQIPKRGHNTVAGPTPQVPTASERPVRTPPTLLCAYGNWTSVDTSFPEDGLCDYAFFDALYRGHQRDSDVARLGRPSAALRHFLAGTRRYRRTQIGVATSYKGLRLATKDMESSHATSDMRALWKNGVRHLGVLDFIPGADTTEAAVERLFKLLQLCRQLLDNVIPNTALPKASLALGMTFMSSNKRQVYANVEKHLRSGWSPSRHKIDLVVLRTHLSGRDDTDPSCTVTGSSVWGRTLADYQPSMIDTLDYVEKKLKPLSSQSLFFVSMSAAVRRYVPIGQDNKAKSFGLGTRCKAYDESDYAREVDNFALVCGDKEYAAHIVRDEAHETMHSFRLSPRSAVTFDSEDTIFAKMCKARKMVASVPYGLALFDAEFDDTSNECSSRNKFGNFTLVRAARRAVDYVYGPAFSNTSQCSRVQ
ncbi:uncharacterized protein LOC119405566 [Rhipicephalus sanguineus]|uniref:uncharacterized protein LOC119405566 n=1 Tax=Rhipicephalus sanguineus TaxID=34632 RepID=UPI0020C2CB0C|nr:uncharacterized protein LOC119405566 [Rhipicephalus sanguineus]